MLRTLLIYLSMLLLHEALALSRRKDVQKFAADAILYKKSSVKNGYFDFLTAFLTRL